MIIDLTGNGVMSGVSIQLFVLGVFVAATAWFRLNKFPAAGYICLAVGALTYLTDYENLVLGGKLLYWLVAGSVGLFVAIVIPLQMWFYWRRRHDRRALRCIQRADYEAARSIYEKLIVSEGPVLDRLMALSVALDYLGKHEEALGKLDQAVELGLIGPVNDITSFGLEETVYLNNRGLVLLHLERFDDALTCLEKSIEHSQEGATVRILALITYGLVYAKMKEKDAALEVFHRVQESIESHTVSDPIASQSVWESKRVLTSEIAKLYDTNNSPGAETDHE